MTKSSSSGEDEEESWRGEWLTALFSQTKIVRAATHAHRGSEKQTEVLCQTEGNRPGVQRAVSIVNIDMVIEFQFMD